METSGEAFRVYPLRFSTRVITLRKTVKDPTTECLTVLAHHRMPFQWPANERVFSNFFVGDKFCSHFISRYAEEGSQSSADFEELHHWKLTGAAFFSVGVLTLTSFLVRLTSCVFSD